MSAQNYKNHVRFYAPHHFILLPLLLILQGFGIYKIFKDEPNQLLWILFAILIFLILFVAVLLRQHYALGNQNRIVRLEFRLRYFELFGKRSDDLVEQLSLGQIAALRFAYDDEFKDLLQRALDDGWSGKQIKKSIKRWRADDWRV